MQTCLKALIRATLLMANLAAARHNFLFVNRTENNVQATFHTCSPFRQTMLGLDSPGPSNDEQGLVASGVAAMGFVVHWSLRLLLADYGKCNKCPCRNPPAFAAYSPVDFA
jgi:hypothetical protein